MISRFFKKFYDGFEIISFSSRHKILKPSLLTAYLNTAHFWFSPNTSSLNQNRKVFSNKVLNNGKKVIKKIPENSRIKKLFWQIIFIPKVQRLIQFNIFLLRKFNFQFLKNQFFLQKMREILDKRVDGLESISSTLNVRIFRTNVVSAAFTMYM